MEYQVEISLKSDLHPIQPDYIQGGVATCRELELVLRCLRRHLPIAATKFCANGR